MNQSPSRGTIRSAIVVTRDRWSGDDHLCLESGKMAASMSKTAVRQHIYRKLVLKSHQKSAQRRLKGAGWLAKQRGAPADRGYFSDMPTYPHSYIKFSIYIARTGAWWYYLSKTWEKSPFTGYHQIYFEKYPKNHHHHRETYRLKTGMVRLTLSRWRPIKEKWRVPFFPKCRNFVNNSRNCTKFEAQGGHGCPFDCWCFDLGVTSHDLFVTFTVFQKLA